MVKLWSVVLLTLTLLQVENVMGSFNLFMDREEVHKLLGLSSEIYLVREGVVNDYALNFVVNVPTHIQHLNYRWQALTKKPVHYEMVIEFADFFALLQPSSNISNVGRLPHKLESFRISLPCSGRLTTEVPVIIRFTFHVKHLKHNVTTINVKRNKICLLKDQSGEHQNPKNPKEKRLPESPAPHLVSNTHQNHPGISPQNSTSSLLFPSTPTAPSLLLAGLLGACAVTASIVSVIFFICLRRKLQKLDNNNSNSSSGSTNTHNSHKSNSGSGFGPDGPYCQNYTQHGLMGDELPTNTNSPACLLRQSQTQDHNKLSRHSKWATINSINPINSGNGENKDTYFGGSDSSYSQIQPPLPPPPVPNSYVTIASFWNDILTPSGLNKASSNNGHRIGLGQNNSFLHKSQNTTTSSSNVTKGSDVSPYAYAQIVHPQPPPLIEWYQSSQLPGGGSGSGHIYANHLSTFGSNFGGSGNIPEKSQGSVGNDDGNYENYCGRSVGSGSLIQIDGFQCPKNFAKETNIIERFL